MLLTRTLSVFGKSLSSCSCFLEDFLASGCHDAGDMPAELTFEQLPFNHPLFIMYSSGTTGVPKCMVHSAGVCNWFTLQGYVTGSLCRGM